MIDPKHYQNALLIQSASNLSGVVLSFCEAIKAINKEGGPRNTHAICRLFAEQISWLTKDRDYRSAYSEAVAAVQAAGMQVPE